MKRFLALFCALFMISSFAFADDDMDKDESESSKNVTTTIQYNEPGDQYIKIGLMVSMPLNFGGSFPLFRDGNLSTGGAGTLGYHRFVSNWVSWGFDVHFGYHPTIGENIFTYIPLVLTATVQPTYNRFEFPITLGVGAAMENYLNRTYFPGLIIKPQAGVFFRATPSWSFGLEGDFTYMPQWYSDSEKNDYGLFGSFVLSARYHF
ncbi:MAG: hypothetical protein KBT11_11475 [Treponema sp.]|nr:hypothetical protein [Candidatus Treponema equifaecale]